MSTTNEGNLIRRYEICRRRFDRRCRKILTQAPRNACPLTMLLRPDEVLDKLDEELVHLEQRLPEWYEFDSTR